MLVYPQNTALFNLGFRPFFLGAGLYSVLIVVVWTLVYTKNMRLPVEAMSIFQWHAHEMIFGYGLAVIAGFLLTATRTWTGIQTLSGVRLAALFSSWLMARLLFLAGSGFIAAAALFDLTFILALGVAITVPIVRARNWRQLGILSILILLGLANAGFYAGYLGWLQQGMQLGIYGALYLVIGLVLTMGSRVIPFFIERGVSYPLKLTNPAWSTSAGIILFIIFFVSELLQQQQWLSGVAACGLFIVYGLRLSGWHTPGIWKNPLLWSLYLAFACIVTGFMLFALSASLGWPKSMAIHMFAYGGIGLMTLSMMARVSLGHTGRNTHEPPAAMSYAFGILLLGVFARVFLPLIDMGHYPLWIVISQGLWILAFLIFCVIYTPLLIRPRADGEPG